MRNCIFTLIKIISLIYLSNVLQLYIINTFNSNIEAVSGIKTTTTKTDIAKVSSYYPTTVVITVIVGKIKKYNIISVVPTFLTFHDNDLE